ncbi:mitochondrial fission regulator 2-like [Ptychodera flava]|uniref:mitochondrial fission regulator 2-like n=1 Tax=Ptychodera flava TaxID=63121 RepID=UPI003969EC1A
MESMGEFDQATPVCTQYCTPVSLKEYETQCSKTTEKSLDDLISFMEQNPDVYKAVLKKKKQEEMENGGIISFLKTRFLTAIGQEVVEVSDDENSEKLEELTDNMVKAFNYSQETKDTPVRFSKRLALKRARRKARLQQSIASENSGPPDYPPPTPPRHPASRQSIKTAVSSTVPPPPPPPPPPPFPLENITCSATRQTSRPSTPLAEKTNTIGSPQVKRKSSESVKTANKKLKHDLPGSSSIADLHSELLKFSHNNLKSTTQHRSPGGTPMKLASRKRRLSASEARKAVNSSHTPSGFSPMSAFNQKILEKFRNAKSPISNVSSPASGFNSPLNNSSAFSSPFTGIVS